MKILAFEMTDAVASVALYLDGEVLETVIDTDRRHAESVLPVAEELLSVHGLSTADMDAFAADVGPGRGRKGEMRNMEPQKLAIVSV